MHPVAKSHKRYFCVCVALIRCKEEKDRRPGGYHQTTKRINSAASFPGAIFSHPTLETGSRVRILDSKFATSEIERSAVVCVVGHGYPTAVGVCIRKESARVEPLVVHERLAMASRFCLIKAGAGVALRAERARWGNSVVASCSTGREESRVPRAMRRSGGGMIVVVLVCARVMVGAS